MSTVRSSRVSPRHIRVDELTLYIQEKGGAVNHAPHNHINWVKTGLGGGGVVLHYIWGGQQWMSTDEP